MKHSRRDILNAVEVIKSECGEHETECYECPFSIEGTCIINSVTPEAWELSGIDNTTWKAFKR